MCLSCFFCIIKFGIAVGLPIKFLFVTLPHMSIHSGKAVQDASLVVHKGEIVAISGLVGAGRTELVHAIFGIDKMDSGEVYINGEKQTRITPTSSIRKGLGLLPESRKEFGLSLILPIYQNITQAALKKTSVLHVLKLKQEKNVTQAYIERLNIVCPNMRQKVINLSGGNQQKVVLGGTALTGGQGSIWGAYLGAIAIYMLRNGMNMLGIRIIEQMTVIGAVLILILAFDVFNRRKEAKKA